jgi:hypothetical protein
MKNNDDFYFFFCKSSRDGLTDMTLVYGARDFGFESRS